MKNEEWRIVEGFEGRYLVSNTGKVKSLIKRGPGRKRLIKPHFIKNKGSKTLYAQIGLSHHNKSKYLYVHRLVAIAFIPNPSNCKGINHRDGDALNNNVDNLEWMTQKDNLLHAKNVLHREMGFGKGEKSGHAKLKENDILEIRSLSKRITNGTLGSLYGVSSNTISAIRTWRSWKHLLPPPPAIPKVGNECYIEK